MYTNILGYNVFNKSKEELIREITKRNKVNIISGNPEVLYTGLKEKELYNSFTNEKAIIIPDGVGTIIAAKIVKKPVVEKIAGIELMEEILKYCESQKKNVYLLGAKDEVVKECNKNLSLKYNNLNIVGYHNGFFDIDSCDDIINEINEKKTDAIFVAMGCPRQEKFIDNYINKLNCNIFMGVGGSFDVFAGNVMRAPKWMISLGLEWMYRVFKEPWRIKRLVVIPKFLIRVLGEGNEKS